MNFSFEEEAVFNKDLKFSSLAFDNLATDIAMGIGPGHNVQEICINITFYNLIPSSSGQTRSIVGQLIRRQTSQNCYFKGRQKQLPHPHQPRRF